MTIKPPLNSFSGSMPFHENIHNTSKAPKNNSQIHFFKTGIAIYKVDLTGIEYILAFGNYSKIYMTNRQPLVVGTPLKEIESLLNQDSFIRIHRSSIVSVLKIEKIKDNIVYINNINLPVGKLYREAFFKLILNY